MRQTMAMLTLLMCSVAASVASLSLSARLPSESEWSMAEREMLKCCPATGSASCSWSRSLQLCLAAPSPWHSSTSPRYLLLPLCHSPCRSLTAGVNLWHASMEFNGKTRRQQQQQQHRRRHRLCQFEWRHPSAHDGTGMAAAPVHQALTSRLRSPVLYPELSLHIVNRRRATRATVSAH